MKWLDDLASPSLGLVTNDGLLKQLTRRQIEVLVSRGTLIRVFKGVYRVAGAPATWEQTQLAGELYLGDRYVSGVLAAARLWKMREAPVAVKHEYLGLDARARKREGFTIRRTNLLLPHHVTTLGPHRLTTAARTLADLSRIMPATRLGKVMDECERFGLATPKEVQKVREEIRARGRRRTTVVDEMLEFRLDGVGPGDSDLASKVLTWIRREPSFPKPTTDLWIVVRGKRYCLDIAWPEFKVCVECDGYDNHKLRYRFDGDRDKLGELGLGGWLAIPVTSAMARWTVVGRVREALVQRGAPLG